MLKIKFKIADDMEELKSASLEKINLEPEDIYGFFSLTIGKQKEIGFYAEGLPEDFIGGEILNAWFGYLLDALLLMRKKRDCTVIMRLIEQYERALLFKPCGDDKSITISFTRIRMLGNRMKIVGYDDKEGYDYDIEWTESGLSYSDIEQTVIEKAKEFILALKEINPILVETNMARSILEKIERLESGSIEP